MSHIGGVLPLRDQWVGGVTTFMIQLISGWLCCDSTDQWLVAVLPLS
jgi:hypothetical protein